MIKNISADVKTAATSSPSSESSVTSTEGIQVELIQPISIFTKNKTRTETTQTERKVTKKKRKNPSICLINCRYDIIRRVAQKFSLKEVAETENWNLYWTDLSISIERCKEMKRFQRINHFPGMLEICRKDLLARNLNRMLKLFPKDYNFFPKTWCLPADLGDALNYSRLRKNKTFILKPDAGSQGKGIFITKSLKDLKPTEKLICQVYISRPFLIDGYKFDLRVYTLITSCDPLRIYIYDEGLVRFATSRYHEPTGVNSTNVFMHLTNYAVNKHSRTYNQDDESGSKRKLSWFNNYMRALGHDVTKLWQRIDEVIIKTVFSALPILRHSYHACFPNHDLVPACCELLGMDILLDRHLSPQLLEVNHSPSFHTDTILDTEVKSNLISDMFNMLNLANCDKRKILREDRRRVQERLLRPHPKENDSSVTCITNKMVKPTFGEYYRHEIANRGGYRLAYPDSRTEHQYAKFLRQTQASLYCDTACSNARQLAAAALRDEIQVKQKEEAAKRVPPNKHKSGRFVPYPITPQQISQKSSFEPQTIVESEEKERLINLAHRDFLVKSYGLVDHIYSLLKQNKALRPADEKKYNIMKSIHSDNIQRCLSGKRHATIENFLDFRKPDNETLTCDMAPLNVRPETPSVWEGSNKTHVARTLSNAVKIHSNINREERNAIRSSAKPIYS